MRLLRRMKAEAALLIALADIGGVWPVMEVIRRQTELADAAVGAAVEYLLADAQRAQALQARRPAAPGRELRLHRARHGQDGRVRAQLFERHRSHRVLRRRLRRRSSPAPSRRVLRAAHARAGEAPAGAHAGRLRVPHRSAAAAGSGLDPDRHLDRGGARLLRERRPELGARRADQGAAVRRRHRGRRGAAQRPRAVHLAQVSRFRRGRRHPRDEAADPCLSRPRRRSRSKATTSSSAAAASARSSSSCRPSSSSPAAGIPSCASGRRWRRCKTARRGRLDRCRGARRSRRRLPLPARGRAPPADGGRRADPHAAGRPRRARALRPLCRLCRPRRLRRGAARAPAQRAAPLCDAVRERARRSKPAGGRCCFPPMPTIARRSTG